MKRKLTCLFLALVLLLGLTALAFAADGAQLPYITDSAGLLTQSEADELESMAQSVSQQYGCGVYVVTVDDYTDIDTRGAYEAAYSIYHQYSLGEGADRSGALLLLSMRERDWATFFYGPTAEYAFNAYGQEKLEDAYLGYFRDNDWYGGFSDYLEVCAEYLERAEAGDPVRGDYSSAGGSDGSGIGTTILVCLGISAVIAMIVCLILRGKMKSVRKGTHADAYVAGSLNLTASRDQYTHTTETRTKIEHESSDSGGGGSSACSGGGGSGRSGSF